MAAIAPITRGTAWILRPPFGLMPRGPNASEAPVVPNSSNDTPKPFAYRPPVPRRPWWRKLTPGSVLGGVAAVAGVVTLVAMLAGDLSYLSRFLPSREGTLIVNVNTASARELETLPGIGPALATLIIAGRPYESIKDLELVQGIGPAKMKSLRPFVIVDGETRSRQAP